MSTLPRPLLHIKYGESAQNYLRSLPLEHFMEATAQAAQRKITLESLDLVHARRPAVQVFNELLVQYPLRNQSEIGKVVPDNMVVLWDEPIEADGSYDLPFQPTRPFWVLEYISKSNRRKDYEESFEKYEKHLKVPYFLMFYPDTGDLTLYRHNGRKYASVKPNDNDRYAIKELDLEVALLDGWVRFWYDGALLPLPGDLLKMLDQSKQHLRETTEKLAEASKKLNDAHKDLAVARQAEERERLARVAAERELAELRAQLQKKR